MIPLPALAIVALCASHAVPNFTAPAFAQSTPPAATAPESPAKPTRKDLERAAERGDTSAMYQLGLLAEVEGDHANASKQFRLASEKGDARAMTR